MTATQNTEDKPHFAKQGNKYQIFLVTEELFVAKATFNTKKKEKKKELSGIKVWRQSFLWLVLIWCG